MLGIAPGPGARTVTFSGVAIAPIAWALDRRARAGAGRGAAAAPRGRAHVYGRAPRGNGRGLYFWLRAGYAPLRSLRPEDDATWFRLPTP